MTRHLKVSISLLLCVLLVFGQLVPVSSGTQSPSTNEESASNAGMSVTQSVYSSPADSSENSKESGIGSSSEEKVIGNSTPSATTSKSNAFLSAVTPTPQIVRTIKGIVSLSEGTAPSGGISIDLFAANNTSNNRVNVVIPEGSSSMEYSINVPAGSGYTLRYSTSNQDFVGAMYYSSEGMVRYSSSAETFDLTSSDKSGLDLTVLKKKVIEGKIKLEGNGAPKGGLNLNVYAVCGSDSVSSSISVPEGSSSAAYSLKVPPNKPGTGYKVNYQLVNNTMYYIPVGYYNSNDTVRVVALAELVDVSEKNETEIGLTVYEKKVISGTVSLPEGNAPSGGLSISLYAVYGNDSSNTTIMIPEGSSSADYMLYVPAGAGYTVRYQLNNIAYISYGYYNENSTVTEANSATPVNVTEGDKPGINIKLIAKRIISGLISLPSGKSAPVGGIAVTVIATNGTNTASVDVSIPEGRGSVPYTIYVPTGAGYKVSYQTKDTSYVSIGYYNSNKTVLDVNSANLLVMGSKNEYSINLTLIEKRVISGKVSLPSGTAPFGGIVVKISTNWAVNSSSMELSTTTTIFQGESSAEYSMLVPPGEDYIIKCEVLSGEVKYINETYYSTGGTVYNKSFADKIKTTGGNQPNINFVLLEKRKVTGTLSLPVGMVAEEDMVFTYTDSKKVTTVIAVIHKGEGSGPYVVYFEPGLHTVHYEVPENDIFVTKGYYSKGGTVTDEKSATVVDVTTGDQAGINLVMILKRTISGTVILPSGVAPAGGIDVTIDAGTKYSNSIQVKGTTTVTIPQGKRSADYKLFIPPGTDYKVRYTVSNPNIVSQMYFNYDSMVDNVDAALIINVTDENKGDIDISLVEKRTISGTVLLPTGGAPAGGTSVNVVIENSTNTLIKPVEVKLTIPEGANSVSYIASVIPADGYRVRYTVSESSDYATDGYYGVGGITTLNVSSAESLNLSKENKTELNLTMVKKRVISGTFSLPSGTASTAITVKIYAGGSYSTSVTIPQNGSSVPYTLKVAPNAAGSGYKIYYNIISGANNIFMTSGYYNSKGMTADQNSAETVDVSSSDKNGVNLMLIPKSSIGGIVSIPRTNISSVSATIIVSNDKYTGTIGVTIPEGKTSAPYTVYVPDGAGYTVRYQTSNAQYVNTGYYGGLTTVKDLEQSVKVNLDNENKNDINLMLIEGKKIEGTINLPGNRIAPAGGLYVELLASNGVDTVRTQLTIPQGYKSIKYTMYVPATDNYKLSYRVNNVAYMPVGYYNSKETTLDENNATIKDIMSDIQGIDYVLISKKAISGNVLMPSGVAPAGGVRLTLYVTQIGNAQNFTTLGVTIPEGFSSVPYTIYVPAGDKYELRYTLSDPRFIAVGYYNVSGTKEDKASATLISAYDDVPGTDIALIAKRIISGSVILPDDYAPIGGIKVNLTAKNDKLTSSMSVTIPEGAKSVPYILYLTSGKDYVLRYDTSVVKYVGTGYYGQFGTKKDIADAKSFDCTTTDYGSTNLILIPKKVISGRVSLQTGVAPYGGINLTIRATNQIDTCDTGIVIPEGSSSASYNLYVPSGTNYKVSYIFSKQDEKYLSQGYYSEDGTVRDVNNCDPLDIGSDNKSGINMDIIPKRLVSGSILLPPGLFAPSNGIKLNVLIRNSRDSHLVTVTIPQGSNSVPFKVYVPDGNEYKLGYNYISDVDYLTGFYSVNGTVINENEASSINLKGEDKNGFNIIAIRKKEISGTIMLPSDAVIPAAGLQVNVFAGAYSANYVITQDQKSVSYKLMVPANKAGTGYYVGYRITTNGSNFILNGYYSSRGTVATTQTADLIDVSDSDKTNINMQILNRRTISGKIILPISAPVGGIALTIKTENSDASTDVVIPAGLTSVDYKLSVLPNSQGSGLKIKYITKVNYEGYAETGYYSTNGTVMSLSEATPVNVYSEDQTKIDIKLIPKNTISGTVFRPSGTTVDKEVLLSVVASNSVNSSSVNVTIPSGENSVAYSIKVAPSVGYKVYYSLAPCDEYVTKGYYRDNNGVSTVPLENYATTVTTVGGNVTNTKLTLIPKKVISGTVTIPGGYAPAGGLLLKVFAENSYFTENVTINIPEGEKSAKYTLYLPPLNDYRVYYQIPSNDDYVVKGYYYTSVNTVTSVNAASKVDISTYNRDNTNLYLIKNRLLSGVLTITGGTIPEGGLDVKVIASNGVFTSSKTIKMPEGISSIQYQLPVTPATGYNVWYEIVSSNTDFVIRGYYSKKGSTVSKVTADVLDLSTNDSKDTNIALINLNVISGIVSLPSGTAPVGGIAVTVFARNYYNTRSINVVIPEGKSSAGYTIYVPDGAGYEVYCVMPKNDIYAGTVYYSFAGSVVNKEKITYVDIIQKSRTDIDFNLIAIRTISGKVTLPEPAPEGGIQIKVTAENGKDVLLTIPKGSTSVPYSLRVLPNDAGSGYIVKYDTLYDYGYAKYGYYSDSGTVRNVSRAKPVDVSFVDRNEINLAVSRLRTISGTISFESGVAPEGGISVDVVASSSADSKAITVYIPEGSDSAVYSLYVPVNDTDDEYKVRYENWMNNVYLAEAYYGINGMVRNKELAAGVNVRGKNVSDINLNLVNKKTISGTLSIPSGTAPKGGLIVAVTAVNSVDNSVAYVTIPEGASSVPYVIYTPAGSEYKVFYEISVINDFVKKGYYSSPKTVYKPAEAEGFDLSNNKADIDLSLIMKKTISGTICLPENSVAPSKGINVNIYAEDAGVTLVNIPEGSNSVPYSLKVSPNAEGMGYKVSYQLSADYGYVTWGYYSINGTVRNGNLANFVYANDSDASGINISVLKPRIVRGTVGLSEAAPKGGVTVNVTVSNDTDGNSTTITIPEGSKSFDYSVSIPPNDNGHAYVVKYENWTNPVYTLYGYYRLKGTTSIYSQADDVDVSAGDAGGINLTLLKRKVIGGRIKVPSGIDVPIEGLNVTVAVENTLESYTANVLIPYGAASAPYEVYVEDGSDYKLSYSLLPNSTFMEYGYYGSNGLTTTNDKSAMILNTSSETQNKSLDLTLLLKRKITGIISLPNNIKAPEGGMEVDISAFNGKDVGSVKVTIPGGGISQVFELSLPSGKDYKLQYEIAPNLELASKGYYGESDTVRDAAKAYAIDLSSSDQKDIQFVMLKNMVINGLVNLPSTSAPHGGIKVVVSASDATGIEYKKEVVIEEGQYSAAYALSVPPNIPPSGYLVKYGVLSENYTALGYYSTNGTKLLSSMADAVDVSENDAVNINLTLIEKKVISGKLTLPEGSVITDNLVVNIKALSELYGNESTAAVIIQPGVKAVPYNLKVVPNVEGDSYKLQYEVVPGKGFADKGCFNTSSTVWDASLASPIDVSNGNYTNANITLIKGRAISGKISLPKNTLAPEGGIKVGVFALMTDYTGYKEFNYVTIPEGKNSIDFELNVPESVSEVAGIRIDAHKANSIENYKIGTNTFIPLTNGIGNSQYKIGYIYSSNNISSSTYSQSGFYKAGGTVSALSEADAVNVSDGDKENINMGLLINTAKIKGEVSIPGVAPSRGIKVDIEAINEKLDYVPKTSVVIPNGKDTISYEILVPSLDGYHIKYSIDTTYGYVNNGFYSEYGMKGKYNSSANVDVRSQYAELKKIMLVQGKAISGRISLPSGQTVKGDSLTVWVTASSNDDEASTYVNIAKGANFADYKVFVRGNGGAYVVNYSISSTFGEYVTKGYFNSMVTTPDINSANTISVSNTDVSNKNLTLLSADRTISGTVSLPEGTGEVSYSINIPANSQDSGYNVGYTIESGNSGDTFIKNGYYNEEGTVSKIENADIIDVSSRNNSNTGIVLLKDNMVKLDGIIVSKGAVTLQAGQSVKLSAKFYPATATNKAVKWYSSNTNVAMVSSEGVVTALSPGIASIKAVGYNSVQAECSVTVSPTKITGLSLDKSSVSLDPGEVEKLKAIFNPDSGIKSLTWSSSDKKVAEVSTDGTVKAMASGKATITVASADDPSIKATCSVTVAVPAVSIKLNKTKADIKMGSTEQLIATVTPEDSTYKGIIWVSSNTKVARVSSNGTITTVSIGTAVITAKSNYNNAVKASCTVNVKAIPVTGITLDKTNLELELYSNTVLTAAVNPEDASDKSVIWTSSDLTIVNVIDQGNGKCVISANDLSSTSSKNTVLITAVSSFDNNIKATCKVVVKPIPVGKVKLDKQSATVKVGEKITLSLSINPAGSEIHKTILWKTSDSSIASISPSGYTCTVTGVKENSITATITATVTDNGRTFSDTCMVTVAKANGDIVLPPIGTPLNMTPTPTPSTTATATPTTASTTPTPTATSKPSPTPTAKVVVQPTSKIPAANIDLSDYKDIKGHWAAEYFRTLLAREIITGYPDKTLRPNAEISRVETTKMVISAGGYTLSKNTDLSCRDKNSVPSWAKTYVRTAMDEGIIKGYEDNTFRPNNKLTRKEMAVIVMKAFGYEEATNKQLKFKDSKDVPSWAKGYVAKAIELGIIKGYDDNTFKPNKTITRAEAAAMIARCIDSTN